MGANVIQAKAFELHQVTVSGPGLAEPAVVSRQRFDIPSHDEDPRAVATEGLLGRFPKSDAPTEGDLGPRYWLRWDLRLLSGRLVVVHQHLYPFADAGPHTFTPPGQRVGFDIGTRSVAEDVPPGWLSFPEELIPVLRLPATPRTGRETAGLPLPWWLLPLSAGVIGSALLFRGRVARSFIRPSAA